MSIPVLLDCDLASRHSTEKVLHIGRLSMEPVLRFPRKRQTAGPQKDRELESKTLELTENASHFYRILL